MAKCLCEDTKWGEWWWHCDVALGDYWHSDITSEEGSSDHGATTKSIVGGQEQMTLTAGEIDSRTAADHGDTTAESKTADKGDYCVFFSRSSFDSWVILVISPFSHAVSSFDLLPGFIRHVFLDSPPQYMNPNSSAKLILRGPNRFLLPFGAIEMKLRYPASHIRCAWSPISAFFGCSHCQMWDMWREGK